MGFPCGLSSEDYFALLVHLGWLLAVIRTYVFCAFIPREYYVETHFNNEIIDLEYIKTLLVTAEAKWTFFISAFVVDVCLVLLARRGILNKQLGTCRTWFIFRIVSLVLYIVFGGFYALEGGVEGWLLLLECVYRMYELTVGKICIDSLNSGCTSQQTTSDPSMMMLNINSVD